MNAMLELCRDLRAVPSFLRTFAAPFLGSQKDLDDSQRKLKVLLSPLIQQLRQKGQEDGPPTVLGMLVSRSKGKEADETSLINKLMMLYVSATSTSTLALSNAVIDLCAMPDYIKPLRDEIKQCSQDGTALSIPAMKKMAKLDSFLKESHRVNQPGLCASHPKPHDKENTANQTPSRPNPQSPQTHDILRRTRHPSRRDRMYAHRVHGMGLRDLRRRQAIRRDALLQSTHWQRGK